MRSWDSAFQVRTVGARTIPVAALVISGTATGSAQTFYTCGARGLTRMGVTHVRNTTATAATLTFHAIPTGGSIGDSTELLPLFNVPANTTLRIDGLLGDAFYPSTVFQVFSGTGSALMIWGTVEEVE